MSCIVINSQLGIIQRSLCCLNCGNVVHRCWCEVSQHGTRGSTQIYVGSGGAGFATAVDSNIPYHSTTSKPSCFESHQAFCRCNLVNQHKMAPNTHTRRTGESAWLLASAWTWPGYCGHLANLRSELGALCLSLSLPMPLILTSK